MDSALTDLAAGIKRLPMAFYFAWSDTKARYRRTMLGPFWLVLGTAVGVAGLGFVWSIILKTDRAVFIPSITVGLVVWQLISSCITDSTNVFVRSAGIIRNLKTPYLIFPIQMILRQLINFAHNFVVIVAVLLIYPPPLGYTQLLVVPGLLILLGNLLWISIVMGIIGARLRDLDLLVNAFMPMLFFVSPVIYRPENMAVRENLVWLNPFSYFITLIRDPIQGVVPAAFIYWVSAIGLVAGWALALALLSRGYKRLAFWV